MGNSRSGFQPRSEGPIGTESGSHRTENRNQTLKPKSTRNNRFKKNRQVQRSLLRGRVVFTARALLVFLALAVASGALIFTYDYFTQAAHFKARRISVTGMQRLSRQQVLAIAKIWQGINILSVNLTTTRKRLLAEPWIANATVSREIPSGLRLDIEEESPLALLEMDSGQGFIVNIAGEIFKQQSPSDSGIWPRIQGLTHADLPVPDKPATKAFEAVMTLLRLAAETDSSLPLAAIRRIRMDREIGATVVSGEGRRSVKLGFGRYRQKCEALGQLMERVRRDSRLKEYRIIDLIDVNRIVMTLASVGPSGTDDKEV